MFSFVGKVPLAGPLLRGVIHTLSANSVAITRSGYMAGYRWRRDYRYVKAYWLGNHEMPVQECLVRELKPGNVFYDIGANAGFFALLGARCVGPEGLVFAFEPHHRNAEYIRSELALNDVANCMLVEVAVAEAAGNVVFCEGNDASTAHIRKDGEEVRPGSAMTVEAVRLDEFVRTRPLPHLAKIDVEGAELQVLRGALGLLGGATRPRLLIEFHSAELRLDGLALLKGLGYRFVSLRGDALDLATDERHVLCVPAE